MAMDEKCQYEYFLIFIDYLTSIINCLRKRNLLNLYVAAEFLFPHHRASQMANELDSGELRIYARNASLLM